MLNASHVLPLALILAIATSLCARANEVVIVQKGKTFRDARGEAPVKSIDVNLGDTLKFKNEDDITHNIYSISKGNEFELKIQKPGQASDLQMDVKTHKVGKMDVECAIHPGMKLTVNVKAKSK